MHTRQVIGTPYQDKKDVTIRERDPIHTKLEG